MPKAVKFFGLILATVVAMLVLKWTNLLSFGFHQMLSIGIFSMFIYGTLLFGEFRLAFAFGGIALLMACSLLTVERFTQAASLDVLVFLIGTFLVIGYLEESLFFEHVVGAIVDAIGPRPQLLLITMMLIASIASALVGEVTAILFMAGAMLHLTSKYKLNPVPFVIMLVFACNDGSAMSSIGNPIGVLIALKTGLSFMDFVYYAAPVAIVVNVATFIICRWYFADSFAAFSNAIKEEFSLRARSSRPAMALAQRPGGESGSEGEPLVGGDAASELGPSDPYYKPDSPPPRTEEEKRAFRRCCVILLGLILLLVTHKQSESWLGQLFHAPLVSPDGQIVHASNGSVVYGLREGTMMVAAALLMGSIVLLLQREKARELVERRVDWWTLSFFMMLFASVGTLQDTGVTDVIAGRLGDISGGHTVVIQVIGWATGWLSAFLDNVLAVATFMPVVHDIRLKAGVPYSSAIYWFMLFGGTFMGNMTIIGSTANIVACGLLERRGHGTISFGYWMKIGFIVSIVSMILATLMLQVQGHFLPMMAPPQN